MKEFIEIPFGAKDSELGGWEYTIPEGYTASIENGKIIVKKEESEDERIIHWIRKELEAKYVVDNIVNNEIADKALAWLEKQGEHNLIEIYPIFRVGDYIRNKKTKDKVLIEQLDIATKAYCYVSYDGAAVNHSDFPFLQQNEWEIIGQNITEKKLTDEEIKILLQTEYEKGRADAIEQKSAWSEEDNYNIERLFCILNNEQDNYPQLSCDFQEIEYIKNWLKSLKEKYIWKPSEEQLNALDEVYKTHGANSAYRRIIFNLLEQLKKL